MEKPQNIIISGLTAAGKTTHAKLLCEEYGLRYISASQILFNLAGIEGQQSFDFWLTPRGRELSRRMSWTEIDNEFRRLESELDRTVFDCQSLPWLRTKECMVIWIESSLTSRVMKAIVSYKGQSTLTSGEVEEGVKSKDRFAREQILTNYNIDLFQDREPFNFIVDISSFITAPTEEASRLSIQNAQEILSSAVGYYLYEDKIRRADLKEALETYGDAIITRSLEKRG
jgi:cytidylate kinase